MPDRRSTLLAAIGCLVPIAVRARDERIRPPLLRSFVSPSGAFELQVRGAAGWPTAQVDAELFGTGAAGRRRLWSRRLPQRYGPATALVSDEGATLLVDEWIHTPSAYALMLLSAGGQVVGTRAMSDIAAISGVPAARLAASATSGPWMSGTPQHGPGRQRVSIEAGGVQMQVDLDTAQLYRIDTKP